MTASATGDRDSPPDQQPPATHPGRDHRAERRGEARLPPAIAILVAMALYAFLPSSILVGPRFLVPVLEGAVLVSLIFVNPWRMNRETRWSRIVAIALSTLIAGSNMVALWFLVDDLVNAQASNGKSLLLAALQVWATNVIAFALIFWELDRGGAVSRIHTERAKLPIADFRFTHDEDDDTVDEVARGSSKVAGWVPTFVDYLFLSTTNSTAFSPTDTMPLTTRAKILMGVESIAALLTSLLVIARAVGALG